MKKKLGIGFASFNNRGHDLLTSVKKTDKRKKKGWEAKVIWKGGRGLLSMSNFSLNNFACHVLLRNKLCRLKILKNIGISVCSSSLSKLNRDLSAVDKTLI